MSTVGQQHGGTPSAADSGGRFEIERYFDGACDAWGIFVDRFGRLRRRFTVRMSGDWDGDTLTLHEDFRYDNGVLEQRVWHIRRSGPDGYVAEADGVIGQAQGRQYADAVNWQYRFRLRVGDRTIRVTFDDWLYRHEDDVVVNRASVRKFGIRLGEVILFFRPAAAQEPPDAA